MPSRDHRPQKRLVVSLRMPCFQLILDPSGGYMGIIVVVNSGIIVRLDGV